MSTKQREKNTVCATKDHTDPIQLVNLSEKPTGCSEMLLLAGDDDAHALFVIGCLFSDSLMVWYYGRGQYMQFPSDSKGKMV